MIISKYLPLVGVTQRVPPSSMMPRGEKSKLHTGEEKVQLSNFFLENDVRAAEI